MVSLPVLLLTCLSSNIDLKVRTLEQYRSIPHPVHLSNSFPTFSSTVLEGVKHIEHALSSKLLSRTEINGSKRTRRDPAGSGCVTVRPLPRPADVESSWIFTLVLDIFVAVEAVTGMDAIILKARCLIER